jgi:hypothetical protein
VNEHTPSLVEHSFVPVHDDAWPSLVKLVCVSSKRFLWSVVLQVAEPLSLVQPTTASWTWCWSVTLGTVIAMAGGGQEGVIAT